MDIPRWSNEMAVHDAAMDAQHKRLFQLAEALLCCDDAVRIMAAAAEITDYTYTHFAAEEAFLQTVGYPGLERQQSQHSAIFRAIDTIVERNAALDPPLFAKELATFVIEWLVRHIRDEDMQYGRFLLERAKVGSTSSSVTVKRPRKSNKSSEDEPDEPIKRQ